MDLLLHRFQGGGFAALHLALAAALQLNLQVVQLAPRLVQVCGQALELSVQQVLIEGHHDGARLAEDFLSGCDRLPLLPAGSRSAVRNCLREMASRSACCEGTREPTK